MKFFLKVYKLIHIVLLLKNITFNIEKIESNGITFLGSQIVIEICLGLKFNI